MTYVLIKWLILDTGQCPVLLKYVSETEFPPSFSEKLLSWVQSIELVFISGCQMQ
jgi:hypothetical protein